jgi:hypothetical protein
LALNNTYGIPLRGFPQSSALRKVFKQKNAQASLALNNTYGIPLRGFPQSSALRKVFKQKNAQASLAFFCLKTFHS